MSSPKHILYLTYDGLTDPLGQSQILPYMKGLTKYGYRFTVLSFEKKERFKKNRALIKALTDESNIRWIPLSFTVKPPLVAKFYDAMRMLKKSVALHKEDPFLMVHCRSYIAADVGLYMKQKFRTKFFFDMRGFWADEKRDGGHWRDDHPITKRVYRYYKGKEKAYLQNADYVISLTEAGRKEVASWPFYKRDVPMHVIPCCADMNLFTITDATQKKESRELLNIPHDALVFSYLGSVGLWYMLPEMLRLFNQAKKTYPNAVFLFVTPTPPSVIHSKAAELDIETSAIIIREATRKEVPVFIKASDINVSFIKPVYSKLSSSPTKLGEVLAMGLPVISNSGVGDVEEIVENANAGFIIHDFSDKDFAAAIDAIPGLLQKSPSSIRDAIHDIYSLEEGVRQYAQCYQSILGS
ncbi:MAG: glycosyltransferase [Gammaproteobacteria bacterium]|nr:MAG: glycosyltransferase [Gammaproteobacteria bacterium]